MSLPSVNMPATDGSDIVAVQINTNPSGGSTPVAIRGYAVDMGAYVSDINQANTRVGEFTGKH